MLADEAEKRSEKLALARKKLKQFQEKSRFNGTAAVPSRKRSRENNRSGKALSEGYPGVSTESLGSLAESTQSYNHRETNYNNSSPDYRRDSGGAILVSTENTATTGFQHDEQRSPFQRVRGPSESSEASSAFAASSRGRTPLEPRTSLEEEDENETEELSENSNQIFPQETSALAAYFQHEEKNEAENSGLDQNFASATQTTMPSDMEERGVANESHVIVINGSAANEEEEPISEPSPGSLLAPAEAPSISNDSIEIGDSASFESLQATNEQLRKTIEDTQQNYILLANQFQQLNSHYAQLHAAYTNLCANQQGDSVTKAEQEVQDLRNEVQKHLQTITVFVQEKTDLQSQLRQALEIANEKHAENQELQGRLNQNRERLLELEKCAEQHSSGRTHLEQTLQKQKTELEKCRRESANLEVKVIELSQDRSEANARLKVKSRELDRIQAELGDMRKEVQMKEIYIRQLTAAGAQPHVRQELEEEIDKLKEHAQHSHGELQAANSAIEHYKRELEQGREQYETYGRQLNQKILELSSQVEKVMEEKQEKEARVAQLETDLEIARESSEKRDKTETEPDEIAAAKDHLDLVEVQQQLQRALQELIDCTEQRDALRAQGEQREGDLVGVREELRQEKLRAERLDEEVKQRSQCSTDTQSLLEQVQNEKATVSRAVAQNRDLKEQMKELEDKFIAMVEKTEERMESESRLQSAEFSAKKFEAELRETKEELDQKKRDCFNVAERLNLVMKASLEKSLREESELRGTADMEMEDLKMQVEALTQQNSALTHKCNLLNAASHDTVADIVSEQHKHHTEELEREVQNLKEKLAEYTNTEQELYNLRMELAEIRRNAQRVGNENAELHRIMQQNAEDENQNTIHVELQQALDRITSLSGQNEELRRRLDEMELATQQRADSSLNNGTQSPEDENSSICSEHVDQTRDASGDLAVENLKSAMGLIQDRFKRAMDQNADLSDQNQHLEHLIIQLQGETETIGEYITIYQHQRKVIREKLKEKELCLAKLSREKTGFQRKLREVQNLVMRLLQERGAMQSYAQNPPTRGRPRRSNSPPVSPVQRREKTESTDSASEIDETRTEPVETEQMIFSSVDGFSAIMDTPLVNGDAEVENGMEEKEEKLSECGSEDSGTAEQILRLLTEMRKPDLGEKLPPADKNLHCKYCTGKLMVL